MTATPGGGTAVETVDAVVVGAGPNGLVAAVALADAGWDVLVLEAQDSPGGAVRTAEVAAPGFRTDLFSAFYPLAAGSPVIRGLHLEEHGLAWARAPSVLTHVLDDGRAAVLHDGPVRTAAGELLALADGLAGPLDAGVRLAVLADLHPGQAVEAGDVDEVPLEVALLVLEGLAAQKRISRSEELGYTRARPERREPGYGKGGISFG